MMPKTVTLDFSLLTLLTPSTGFPKVLRIVRLSTPGVRYRTVCDTPRLVSSLINWLFEGIPSRGGAPPS